MTECSEDKDMLNMATEEIGQAIEEERKLQNMLLKSLLPKDDADERDCILEVRAGKLSMLKMEIYCLCSSKASFNKCLLTCLRSCTPVDRFASAPYTFCYSHVHLFILFLQGVVGRRLPCLP